MKLAFDPSRLLLPFRAAFCRTKSDIQISSEIIAALECRSVDSVRAMLAGMTGDGRSVPAQNAEIRLGTRLVAQRHELESWLKEKAAADARRARIITLLTFVGTVAAIIAALPVAQAFLAWLYPLQ